jgi:flagellar basal body P-ring formation protein FlgA
MTRFFRLIALALLLATGTQAAHAQGVPAQGLPAQAQQPHSTIKAAVEEFLRVQTSGLPGKATYTAGAIDPRLQLAACGAMDVFSPPGSRLWGTTSVGVRCGAPTPWTIYVTVTVRVSGAYLASARALTAGQPLAQSDFTVLTGDLTQMPAGVATDGSQVVGKTLVSPLAAGQPIRADLLRTPNAVLSGQNVKVVSEGAGFRVAADGKAVNNAAAGQVAQVRMNSGQTVSGIARADGMVEIKF